MKKTYVGITVVGKDREGAVAAFTNMVFDEGGNVEKISQNVVKGVFGMYLEVSFTKKTPNLERRINELAKKFKMDSNAHYETGKRKNVAVFVTKEPHCLDAILKVRKRRYFVFLHNRLEISCAKSASVDTGKCAPCCSMEPIGITAMRFLSVSLRSSESNPSITLDIYITF